MSRADDRDLLLERADALVARARRAGADVAEAVARSGRELSVKVRLGQIEQLEEAGSRSIALRVMIGQRQAATSTSDLSEEGLNTLVEDAIELAKLSEPDPLAGPPEATLLSREHPDLALFDPSVDAIEASTGVALARRAEDAARGADPRITNSEGASFSRTTGTSALVTSGGFRGAYRGSSVSLYVAPVADDANGKKQRAAYWDGGRFFAALEAPETIGLEAARRTVAQLGAKKVPTGEYPIVFLREPASALLGLLLGCVNGGAIYRRASYLADKLGQPIGAPDLDLVDDPLVLRGPGSRPFDGEGLASRRNVVVQGGVLERFLLDTYSARKLGQASTASAARGGAMPSPSATNFWMTPGEASPEQLVAGLDRGLVVTGMMGFGFNAVTGDFSRGAEGYWVERGERVHPVAEVTVSLGFPELWSRVEARAADLDRRSRVAAPALRVARMTVAGS
jgi:PmbA protein